MLQAPWTDIGRIQSEISSIENQIRGKADNHEIHSIHSRLDNLERECREIRSLFDGIRSELQTAQENILRLQEARDADTR
jgi:archaellum component FlaC